jgi:glycerophosphoryl diester phosphodiesterase
MAAWTLLLWTLVVLLLVPLSSALIGLQVRTSQRLVIGNEELLAWLLTPTGLGYLLLAGSVLVMNWVLRYACLYQLITDDLEGRRPSLAAAALRLAAKLPTLVRFSLKAVALALLAAAPVLAGAWWIYRLILGQHDINYYLTIKPPAWYQALAALGVWLVLVVSALVYFAGRFVLALPSWLDGYRGFAVALRRSWQLTRTRAVRVLRLLAIIAAGWIGSSLLLEATFFAIASRITEWVSTLSPVLWPTVACAGAYLAGSVLLNVTIGFLGFSFLSVVLTTFYFEDTPLHRAAPPAAAAEEPTLRGIQAVRHWLSPRRLVLLLALLLTISIFTGRQFLQNLPQARPILVMAHRGGPPPAPENTLAALERAIAVRADFAEIDVLRTRDGTVVVTHDADLMRLARDPRRIADTSYAELSRVVKLPDDGSPPEERRLATLGDFLERARGRIKLNIELKYYGWDSQLACSSYRKKWLRAAVTSTSNGFSM